MDLSKVINFVSEQNERVLGFFWMTPVSEQKNSQHLGWPKVSFLAGSPSGFPGVGLLGKSFHPFNPLTSSFYRDLT